MDNRPQYSIDNSPWGWTTEDAIEVIETEGGDEEVNLNDFLNDDYLLTRYFLDSDKRSNETETDLVTQIYNEDYDLE